MLTWKMSIYISIHLIQLVQSKQLKTNYIYDGDAGINAFTQDF